MKIFRFLFVAVFCFQTVRPGTIDVPGNQTAMTNGTTELEDSVEEKLKELRIEMVKFQILSKLNLKDAPPSAVLPTETSREMIRLLMKDEEEKNLRQSHLFDSEEQLVINSKRNGMPCLRFNGTSCKMFQYNLSSSLNTSSMDIFIYKLTEFPRWISISLTLFSSDKEKYYDVLYYELNQVGWNKLELPRILLPSSWNGSVLYSVEVIGQNIEDHGDHRPFLMVTKYVYLPARQRRDVDCDTNESCCLKPLKFSFTEIGFDWVLYPDELEANMCTGKCTMDHSAMRTHYETAITKVLESDSALRETLGECWTLCCKPKVLDPVRVIYNDTDGIIHVQHIPELSVRSCSCS